MMAMAKCWRRIHFYSASQAGLLGTRAGTDDPTQLADGWTGVRLLGRGQVFSLVR